MIPRINGCSVFTGETSSPLWLRLKGIITDFFKKWVVFISVSACSFLKSVILLRRTYSDGISFSVLMFGSLWQFSILWPTCLQQKHLTWFLVFSSSSYFSSWSSSLSAISCLLNLHPSWSFDLLPQHHHISPLQADWCVRHDQLKFSFWLNSFKHFLHC